MRLLPWGAARLSIERENHVKSKSLKAIIIIIIVQAFINVQKQNASFYFRNKKIPLEFECMESIGHWGDNQY